MDYSFTLLSLQLQQAPRAAAVHDPGVSYGALHLGVNPGTLGSGIKGMSSMPAFRRPASKTSNLTQHPLSTHLDINTISKSVQRHLDS